MVASSVAGLPWSKMMMRVELPSELGAVGTLYGMVMGSSLMALVRERSNG